MSKPLNIAIDGPSGAGKSTLARILAQELQFIYVDTGALYRAVGQYMLLQQVNLREASAVEPRLSDLQVDLRYMDGQQRVFVNGTDVSDQLRTPEVSMAASAVSAIPAVRRFLLQLQQDMAAHHNVIMDGRDIGTVILPHAQLKIFLTATPEERAARRYEELNERGTATTYEEVLSDMIKRDYDDEHRAAAPLKPAADAVLVNTTGNTLEQSVAFLKNIVKDRLSCG